MRFQVPQFIEVEDKIFGPLTFKQFVYVAGGIGVCVLLFLFLPKFIAILISAPVAAFAGALAFYKYNDKPFINLVEAFFNYTFNNKLYVWKKGENEPTPKAKMPKTNDDSSDINQVYVPKLSESKLKDLSWSLDIKENNNPVTENEKNEL